jgi:2-aminoadipate transaminase
MFVWVTLPDGVPAEALLAATLPRGVAFAPGRSFYPVDPRADTLRLNFTLNDTGAIDRGLRVIAEETARLVAAGVRR